MKTLKNLEWILSNCNKADMISYVTTHPGEFDKLIKMAIADQQPYSRKAAWLLWSCMVPKDKRLEQYLKRIIDVIAQRCDEQQRDLLIILQKTEIEEELEGILFDHCISVWEKINKKPSVRYNAFKMLIKIVRKYPDLFGEIKHLTEKRYMESLSSGVKRSINRMIQSIDIQC